LGVAILRKTIEYTNEKINFWLDEFPQMPRLNTKECNVLIASTLKKDFTNTKIALEISRHVGPFIQYGLLGTEFQPAIKGGSHLEIKLNYILKNEVKYDGFLYNNSYTFCGMHSWCERGTFDGTNNWSHDYMLSEIKKHLNLTGKIPPGILNFSIAANDEVGSSPKMFSVMAKMLIDLIAIKNTQQVDDWEEVIKDVYFSSELFKG